jgi:hypothetical protein
MKKRKLKEHIFARKKNIEIIMDCWFIYNRYFHVEKKEKKKRKTIYIFFFIFIFFLITYFISRFLKKFHKKALKILGLDFVRVFELQILGLGLATV